MSRLRALAVALALVFALILPPQAVPAAQEKDNWHRDEETSRSLGLSGAGAPPYLRLLPELFGREHPHPTLPPPEPADDDGFTPLDISLSEDLQLVTWQMCQKYPTPLADEEFFDLVLRVMWHESRYIANVPDNVNRNGSRDRGLMQINSCVWQHLQSEYSLDVSDPAQNIEAGVMFLSGYLNKYSPDHALSAYALGEAGARNTGGYSAFSVRILSLEPVTYLETGDVRF